MAEDSEKIGLDDVIDGMADIGSQKDRVSVGDIQEKIGERSFGPFLFIPAMIEISPVGGIPGLPTMLAVIVILVSAQMLLGRKHFWLPAFLANRSVSGNKLKNAMDRIQPLVRWTDKIIHERLSWATEALYMRVVALLCILLALTVPPLELIPFASTAPFGTIGLFGLALMAKDGLLVLIGMAFAAGAFILGYVSLV
ncbi:exopolysaccharide biosynthesis protein [Telmatospirillum sp. J64-1]|uniref:exopolysaccharide biosynthesis protein n=1 Tax=Telmatospirillum sp. J64-1 TaxID=2502183 RepID=UPI001C8F9175|nr:exopolysaccharide biosynthesis protein [Telmatospirillum sp. J64-1]